MLRTVDSINVVWIVRYTAARIMSTTLEIGNRDGWLNPQLEKKAQTFVLI